LPVALPLDLDLVLRRRAGNEKPTPKVSFHDAEPAVWRPGVGSAM
jgi:hypothetical protein